MNSKFIGYVAGLLVIDRQMKNAWLLEQLATRKEHQASLS
jgi:hypothetical protein